jgi:hypothetical protein
VIDGMVVFNDPATWQSNWIELMRAEQRKRRLDESRRLRHARYMEQRKAEREAEAKQHAAGKPDKTPQRQTTDLSYPSLNPEIGPPDEE